MVSRYTKLRVRRHFRRRQQTAIALSEETSRNLDRHVMRRLGRVRWVQRFIAGWMLLMALLLLVLSSQWRQLGSYYLTRRPVAGGIYSEGIVGVFRNANPLYSVGSVDASLSRLVFSSLFTYDENGKLVPDLAEKYDVDTKGSTFTVTLKNNALWHDGVAVTSDDVVFTYRTIQNPDARSPLSTSWQGIKVTAKDARTIEFVLPSALASFPQSLTNGIVPKHLLESKSPLVLRSDLFNTNPIGSGPFSWGTLTTLGSSNEDIEQVITLRPNDKYYRGRPKLDQFVVRTFPSEKKATSALASGSLQGLIGLTGDLDKSIDSLEKHNLTLDNAVMLFFKTTQPLLSDVKMRQALIQTTNVPVILSSLDYGVREVNSPLLKGQVGYSASPSTVQLPQNLEVANALLNELGWPIDKDGWRKKDGKVLEFTITSESNTEYAQVIGELQKQWRIAGIRLNANLQTSEEIEQTYILPHNYDMLLYGIAIGQDPDVFAYWHSSQADVRSTSRLNLSEWKSGVADASLEAGRTRFEDALRTIKYRPFLEAWHNEVPAIGLYQPRVLYVTSQSVYGFKDRRLITAADRLNNVNEWMIRDKKSLK